jgi:hypothetical protein
MRWRNRSPAQGWLALQALLGQARLPTWRLWARDAAIEKKDVLKTRGYAWSPGEFGRPKCWYRAVADADRTAEVLWLRANVMGPDQVVWALRITARDRYLGRCWVWGEPLAEPIGLHDHPELTRKLIVTLDEDFDNRIAEPVDRGFPRHWSRNWSASGPPTRGQPASPGDFY